MHLAPREIDKVLLHNVGAIAQKRLARGLRLNYPEAVALISTQLLEFIRDGHTVANLMDLGRKFLGRADVGRLRLGARRARPAAGRARYSRLGGSARGRPLNGYRMGK